MSSSTITAAFKRCRARQVYAEGSSRWGVAKRGVSGEAFPLYRPEPLDVPPPLPQSIPSSRAELRQAVGALEDETRALRRQVDRVEKTALTNETTADLPPYTDAELENFYRNVMSSSPPVALPLIAAPETTPRRDRLPKGERREVVKSLIARLEAHDVPESTKEDAQLISRSPQEDTKLVKSSRATQRNRAVELISRITPASPTAIPTGLITTTELLALFDESLAAQSYDSASQILDSARAHGMGTLAEQEEAALLEARARDGDVAGVMKQLAAIEERTGTVPDRTQLAALITAHLAAGQTHTAVRTLHTFESRNLTLPEPAYANVISALLSPRTTLKQADKSLAWDLFTHMRLVAHPVPSIETYNAMIRSCSDPKDPQPELALDMFTQMVSENGQTPSAETYNVLIRALGKVKSYYHEAFRVLRQMLEVHQGALTAGGTGRTGYEPTVTTFNALLEGTKRTGDLGRARWILAEMAKIGAFMGDDVDVGMMPNEETLVGVFHTYAAYRPVVARGDVKVVKGEIAEDPNADATADVKAEADSETETDSDMAAQAEETSLPQVSLLDIGSPDFVPPYQPQTSYEVYTEATQLFDLVIDNMTHRHGAFGQVRPTSRLVNAYLSVALAHAPLERAVVMQMELWNDLRIVDLGIKANGWTYLFALERCAAAKNKTERKFVEGALEKLWQRYVSWYAREDNVVAKMKAGPVVGGDFSMEDVERYRMDVGLGPREVERSWVAAIRAFALVENSSLALDMLGEFRDRFPPDTIIAAHKPSARFANKIRFSSSHRTLEDDIPPHILFHDMEILHHRFVRDGNLQAVGKIKWITLGYQLALEKRKSLRLAEKNAGRSDKTSIRPEMSLPRFESSSDQWPAE